MAGTTADPIDQTDPIAPIGTTARRAARAAAIGSSVTADPVVGAATGAVRPAAVATAIGRAVVVVVHMARARSTMRAECRSASIRAGSAT